MIAASENGEIYRYLWRTGQLEKVFNEHSEVVTDFLLDGDDNIFSVSLDGFMKKFELEVRIFDHLYMKLYTILLICIST